MTFQACSGSLVTLLSWWTLVAIRLQQKDYKALAAALSGIEEKLQQSVGDLAKEPDFADSYQERGVPPLDRFSEKLV